jgi:hypothetical protein
MCSSLTGRSYRRQSIPTMYLQFMDSAVVTMCYFHFYYWPVNIKRHTRVCSYIHMYSNRSCKTWCDCLSNKFYADFGTAIPNAVRRVWPRCEVKTFRFHLGQNWWSKIRVQFLGLSKQYRKKERLLSK